MNKKKSTRKNYFVVCVRNDGYPASLERRKIYRALHDQDAAQHRYLRVVDESGEDYLYPAKLFEAISLPISLERAFKKAG